MQGALPNGSSRKRLRQPGQQRVDKYQLLVDRAHVSPLLAVLSFDLPIFSPLPRREMVCIKLGNILEG